jgi:MFS family permease
MSGSSPSKNPMLRVLSLRDFRLLFGGATTSILGDQFAMIATPWLVLQLTRDPLVLGFVLALGGIPRAVFMLLGGAVTDRFSPRRIMIASDSLRLGFTLLMALAVLSGNVHLWMLYVFNLGFGLVAGFAIPATNSIVPMLVEDRDLQAGNSVILGSNQLVGFIGPTAAGLLIAGFSRSLLGIGLAYGLDALSFAISAGALILMRGGGGLPIASGSLAAKESIFASILVGLKYLWNDGALRLMFLVVTVVNFLFIGPLMVGIPVLANRYLPGGAAAFGLLMSGLAGGQLAGYLLAGQLPRPDGKVMKYLLLAGLAAFGVIIGSLGFIRSTEADFVIMILLGLGNGYLIIIALTWIQARTPKEILGRTMSMLMLSTSGLSPVSQAISGAAIKGNIVVLFAVAGALLFLVPVAVANRPELDIFSESLANHAAAVKK